MAILQNLHTFKKVWVQDHLGGIGKDVQLGMLQLFKCVSSAVFDLCLNEQIWDYTLTRNSYVYFMKVISFQSSLDTKPFSLFEVLGQNLCSKSGFF